MELLPHTIEILERLVSFDTTSRNSNLQLIEWVEEYLRPFPSVTAERLHNTENTKAALLITVGGGAAPGLVFSGHTDVVPVDGQSWTGDPFQLTLRGQRLYGRGTSDMKGFIACCLAMIPRWATQELQRPLHFAFSYDEEIGCRAAARIGETIVEKGWKPLLVIVGEPTLMQPVTAHKGIYSFLTTVTGREAHSSQTQLGVNAIRIAARLIHRLHELGEAAQNQRDARFTPPYTTTQVGVIRGGTARNIIPRHCEFEWEIRPLPGDDPSHIWTAFEAYQQELEAEVKRRSPDCGIVTRPVTQVTSLKPESDEDLLRLMLRLAESNAAQCVSYGTEGGILQSHGLPCFICGPGSIEQAHIPDEFIEIEQLERCLAFMGRIEEELF